MISLIEICIFVVIPVNFCALNPVEAKVDKELSSILNLDKTDDQKYTMQDILGNCNKANANYFKEIKNKLIKVYKGLAIKLIESIIKKLVKDGNPQIPLCDWARNNETDRVFAWINEFASKSDKHDLTPRYGLFTILEQASQPNTKITLPLLTCYLQKYFEKLVALSHDNRGIKLYLDIIWRPILELLEKEEKLECELSLSDTNPTKFKSLLIAFLNAINNLTNKSNRDTTTSPKITSPEFISPKPISQKLLPRKLLPRNQFPEITPPKFTNSKKGIHIIHYNEELIN